MKSGGYWFVSLRNSFSRRAKQLLGRGTKGFFRTSPFLILSFCTAFILLYQLIFERGGPDEWRHPLLLTLLFFLILIVVSDLVLKHFIKKNSWLWVIELFMCLGFIYYWIVT